jgi:hypothetical protein
MTSKNEQIRRFWLRQNDDSIGGLRQNDKRKTEADSSAALRDDNVKETAEPKPCRCLYLL